MYIIKYKNKYLKYSCGRKGWADLEFACKFKHAPETLLKRMPEGAEIIPYDS